MSRFTRSAVHNPQFQYLYVTENATQCIIFSITEHIFYPAHVVLIPQAPFFTSLLVHKSAFFTNFTFHTHLKRQYCVFLTFWICNRSWIVSFNQKRAISPKITRFCKICVNYHVSCVLLFKICTLIFRNLPKTHIHVSYYPQRFAFFTTHISC